MLDHAFVEALRCAESFGLTAPRRVARGEFILHLSWPFGGLTGMKWYSWISTAKDSTELAGPLRTNPIAHARRLPLRRSPTNPISDEQISVSRERRTSSQKSLRLSGAVLSIRRS
jgi:hypothetical protein